MYMYNHANMTISHSIILFTASQNFTKFNHSLTVQVTTRTRSWMLSELARSSSEPSSRQPNPESTGYSSGGLMETRIGAVGGAGGGAARESPLVSNGHVTPGELAHMY